MAEPILTFDVMGDTQVMRGFSRFADGIKDLSEAFKEIAEDFHKGERQQFQSEGGYGAGGWVPLAPSTIERKEKGGYPMDILVRTGELRQAMAGEGGAAIEEIRPLEMRLGTTLAYARFHQKGTRGMPARPIIMLPEEQKTRWHKIIQKYLVQQAREAFGTPAW
jgi:phage gpG-like protein